MKKAHILLAAFFVMLPALAAADNRLLEESDLYVKNPEELGIQISRDVIEVAGLEEFSSGTNNALKGDLSEKRNDEAAAAGSPPEMDFDDDYDYKDDGYDGNDDSIVWGGEYLDVGVDSQASGTDVICYDWCNSGFDYNLDTCFYKDSNKLAGCRQTYSKLDSMCKAEKCVKINSLSADHEIDTGSSGDAWVCPTLWARYYMNCGKSSVSYGYTEDADYYVINERAYYCDEEKGTYSDIGRYDKNRWVYLHKAYSCGPNKGCDLSKELYTFGSKGRNAPDKPCSLFDGKGDCDKDSDCFPGSHCSEAGSTDICCPDGTEWSNGECRKPCPDEDQDGYKDKVCGGNDCDDSNVAVYPGAAEACNAKDDDCDGQKDEGDACKCLLEKAYWSRSTATEGENVTLTVTGNSNCNGKTAKFIVKEADSVGDDDAENNPGTAIFSNKLAKTTWVAEWQNDCGGACNPPEYYFTAKVEADNAEIRSTDMAVNKYCPDNDKDGYSSEKEHCGAWDCNDSDADIHPEEAERCNGKDDNCDGKIPPDETTDSDGDSYVKCIDCNDDNAAINPSATEKCNNVDDNCNSQVDDGFEADNCKYLCSADKTAGDDGIAYDARLFTGNNFGIPSCCGDDANEHYFMQGSGGCCNEITDCVNYHGACVNSGEGVGWKCHNHKWSDECTESNSCQQFYGYKCSYDGQQWGWRSQMPEEKCNNFDDDCDGTIDNGLIRNCGTNIGECEYGTETCSYGEWKGCIGGVSAKNEECNKKDDDCDWSTDEDNVCCNIPDGRSADCECDNNEDCPTSYQCELGTGWDACVKRTCTDECNNTNQHFCEHGNVYLCLDSNNDGCNEAKIADVCGPAESCLNGQSQCKQATLPVQLYVEDAASNSVTVYKQPGDTVKIRISSGGMQKIAFSAPDEFELVSGNCFNEEIDVVSGDNYCVFTINSGVPEKTYYITAAEKAARVKVVTKPKTIIITNKEKLSDRFETGVSDLLKQAFQTANDQKDTVIYYLDRELTSHPFESFSSYYQDPLNPDMSDNSYSLSVAELIEKKCNGCKNIIILGDDYVVPFYRTDYDYLKGWYSWSRWLENKTETRYIFTDQPYIKTETKAVSDLDSVFLNTKKIRIVLHMPASQEISAEISKLKEDLSHYYQISDIETINADETVCNDFAKLKDATLILIGTREDNKAIRCVPWFGYSPKSTDTFDSVISVERNVWGKNKYAVVISGKKPETGIKELDNLLMNSEQYKNTFLDFTGTAYIHQVSMPDVALSKGDMFLGYVTGKCENVGETFEDQLSCIGTDFVASAAPITGIITDVRDVALYCPTYIKNKATGKKQPITNGVVCFASAGGAAVPAIGLMASPETGGGSFFATQLIDSIIASVKRTMKTINSAFKNTESILKPLDKANFFDTSGFLRFFKIIKEDETSFGLIKDVTAGKRDANKVLEEVTTESNKFTTLLQANKVNLVKLTDTYSEDALAASLKTAEDYEDITKGTEEVLAYHPLTKIAPGVSDADKVIFLKNTGKISGEVANNIGKIADIKGVDKVTHNIVTAIPSNKEGYEWEAKVARILKDNNKEVIELGRIKKVDYVNPKDGKWVYNAYAEIDSLWKNNDGKIIANEVKAVDWNNIKNKPYYNDRLDDLETQFRKLRALADIDEIRLVSAFDVTDEVVNLADEYNIIVKVGNEVI